MKRSTFGYSAISFFILTSLFLSVFGCSKKEVEDGPGTCGTSQASSLNRGFKGKGRGTTIESSAALPPLPEIRYLEVNGYSRMYRGACAGPFTYKLMADQPAIAQAIPQQPPIPVPFEGDSACGESNIGSGTEVPLDSSVTSDPAVQEITSREAAFQYNTPIYFSSTMQGMEFFNDPYCSRAVIGVMARAGMSSGQFWLRMNPGVRMTSAMMVDMELSNDEDESSANYITSGTFRIKVMP